MRAGAGTSAPSAATATVPADAISILQRYALTQADLPGGYTVGQLAQVPNDQDSNDYADHQAASKEIQQTQRQGGIGQQVLFTGADTSQIGVSIELFKATSGAQQWLVHPPAFPSSLQTTPATLTQKFGDQTTALHWTQGSVAGYVISFRRGRVVFGLAIAAAAGKESLDPLLPLAESLDNKAKKVGS